MTSAHDLSDQLALRLVLALRGTRAYGAIKVCALCNHMQCTFLSSSTMVQACVDVSGFMTAWFVISFCKL